MSVKMNKSFTDDACAILLLCAFQGGENDYQPLCLAEYNQVAQVLHRSGKRPGSLLATDGALQIPGISTDRLQWLLSRRINLGFILENWQRKGLWILVRSDETYPRIIRQNLGNQAPPILYGTGNQRLLSSSGFAVIGPDSIPKGRIQNACEIAVNIVKEGRTVIAAGHLKMAREIVETVERHTGQVLWVLHDGALNQRLQKSHREAIRDHRLAMMTAQSPHAPKNAGHQTIVASLASGLADELLYVDGRSSKDQSKRKDQFGATEAARQHSEICRLLLGRAVSDEAQKLHQDGLQKWSKHDPSHKVEDFK